jgi:hypothetical protein
MSPVQLARRKATGRTMMGMAMEMAYVLGLAGLCCLLCALAYFSLS